MIAICAASPLLAGAAALRVVPAEAAARLALEVAVIALASCLVCLWLRVKVRAGIRGTITATAQVINKVANGDLTGRVTATAYGQTQDMLDDLQRMTDDLRAVMTQVTQSARSVADCAAQIAQGNLDLSRRTEEEASTLEELASSMEELSSTVTQNAEGARQASRLAAEASEAARNGGQAVDDAARTMDEILEASRRIGDIIGLIDGVAFQTNILALNAAVEAARAGEHGRGFAVVAAEVRNLAQRTAASAREIKSIILDAGQKVEAGATRAGAAGRTMGGVVSSVGEVSRLIAEIAAASQEQSMGLGQVTTAMADIERVVQQNAALVEEATAATESLKEQAAAMLVLVSRFRLGDEAQSAAAMPLPHRTPEAGALRAPGTRARVAVLQVA
jgi:methyl-accepting chemotaxis protein